MALVPLKIPAGIYRNGTEYQAMGRWYDSNLVRWFEGTLRPVGGWLLRGLRKSVCLSILSRDLQKRCRYLLRNSTRYS